MKEIEVKQKEWSAIWEECARVGNWSKKLVKLGLKPDLQKKGILEVK